MYTGIVAGAFPISRLERKPGLLSFAVALSPALREDLAIGASVGLDGVCMTVTQVEGDQVAFDAMQQTLSLTTLGGLREGDLVNVERSAKQGAEIGGHLISGHIDATGELRERVVSENNLSLVFSVPQSLLKYCFTKGFIGLHGCSLTLADVDKAAATLTVCLIPETLRRTNLGHLKEGDRVNLEVDRQTQVIVDTVERVLAERLPG
ncbi:riboflavin synthase subunit alpha [Spongiibacter taiwanensis]|uniref:riboflavin synthase subunit alpha n=1 Tax=Spongiibacter taiwanensis TaxID=1748242 RepID=UPI00203578F6|nr:riboflavin synthase subunit alpha [Spongiibacter taiwanensis]USA41976.1 riboflavin synthase subunit alpha [Spongiibacter taiwanensis]